ncbi:MAG: hypothetical protein ACRDM0_00435 [Thermoleophilaceae bacterium]
MIAGQEAPKAAAGAAERDGLRRAILLTLAYADVFDHPLSAGEIHRFLIGVPTSRAAVEDILDGDPLLLERVGRTNGWYHLAGRGELADTRRRRNAASARLWPVARRYASVIARLPLVRLVAVTGALAMDNADGEADIDLFILARPRRVWLCRLLVLAAVKVAALRGHQVCPNFVLSSDRLRLAERNLFTAHEFAQMVPVGPTRWYGRFLEANGWAREMLPNALDAPVVVSRRGTVAALATAAAESFLGSRAFGALERWEMRRKIRRLLARAEREGGSVAFTADECRGHFAAHDTRALAAFTERAMRVTEGLP